jgi:GTP-binding protein
MAETVRFLEYQLIVLATKADKLKTNERKKNIALIEKTLSMGEDDILIPFSSVTKEGKEDVLDLLSQVKEEEPSCEA